MTTSTEQDRYLNPVQAATLLADAGLPVSRNYLAKLRCIGGGPRFRKFGKHVLYRHADLTAWADARMSAPLANTADVGVAG